MNGLYQDNNQKKQYLNNSFLFINGFYIGFIGFVGLGLFQKSNPVLTQYYKQNYQFGEYINKDDFDYLNDYIVSIKILQELNIFNIQHVNLIMNFLQKNYKNGFKNISQNEFRKILKSLPLYKIRPDSQIYQYVFDFISGKIDLEFILYKIYLFNEQYKISMNFSYFANIVKKDLIKYDNPINNRKLK